jgi:hypothetical protein
MAIHALSLQEFDRLNAARATVARHTDKAVEWFADDADAVLGAIAYDQFVLEWSLVVLRRDQFGQFRPLDRDRGLRVLDEARRVLVEKMALARGNRVSLPSWH